MERLIKKLFGEAFERFDRTELVKDLPSSNGETEIYRVRLKALPDFPGKLEAHGSDSATARHAFSAVEKMFADIVEGRARRNAALMGGLPGGDWNDDEFDEPELDIPAGEDDAHDELVKEFYEDIDTHARTRDEGWPYEDGDDN